MNSREILREAAAELRAGGVPDPIYDSALILSEICGMPPLELRAGREITLTAEDWTRFREMTESRSRREPLQYLLGTVIFCGQEFRVGPGALIPRPETELLAEWAAEHLRNMTAPEVLDLCCGSGCLGLSAAGMKPDARITLTDLSPEALKWAEENRRRLGVRCEILQGDLFAPVAGRKFDCILSNPPYVSTGECDRLQPEVLREPRLALDGGADGMDFYRRIALEAPAYLHRPGFILMEVGDGEAGSVADMLRASGAGRTEIREDYSRIPRMVCGEYE